MDLFEYIKFLFSYDMWANLKVISAVQTLNEQELSYSLGNGYVSPIGTLAHMVSSQNIWLSRWTRAPQLELNLQDLDDIKAAALMLNEGILNFINELGAEGLQNTFEYERMGARYTGRYFTTMLQVVNHGTYHRGELSALLTHLEHSFGDIDLIHYARQQQFV